MTRTTTAPPPTDGTATGESREERIERLHKFLDTYSSTTLLVTVSDPFKTRRFLQTKRMFHVTTMDPTAKAGEEQWSVERSFDDFVLLRRTLQNRFPGILVSELPEDDTLDMFKSTSSKLTKQTETLTHWIMHLSRHPFASIDVVFLIFLSGASKFSDSIISLVDREDMSQLDPTSSSKMLSTLTAGRARRWFMNHFSRHHTTALEKLAQDETAHHGPYLYDNEAATTSAQWWWHEALEVAENPDDPDTLARNVVHEIERVKLSLKECNVVLLGLAASHKTTAGAYDVLAKTIGTWLGAEYSKDLLGTTDPEQNQVLQSEALHDTTHQEDESSSSSSSSSSGDRVQPYRGGLSRPTTLPIILAATTGDESQYISMPSALTRAVRRMKRQARTEKQLSENALITLIAAIRFELLYLDTLRDAVVDTEGRFDDEHTLSRMLRAREREVQDLEGQHRSNTMLSENFPEHRMDESRTSAVERRYYQAKSARDDLAAKVEAACHVSNLAKRATMSVELNYFRTERVLRITTFLQEFADVHAQFGETTSALWGGIGEVGTFPLSAMEQLQILQQQPLSRKTRSICAVIPPKPAISAQIRQQQKRLLEAAAEPSPALDTTTTTITSKTTTKPQEGRSKKLQIVQDEEKRPLPEPSQEEEEEEEQRAPERQLLEGAPTEITKEGVTQERKGAVDDMTLAQARAIIAKYKYGGQEEAKEEEEEEERKPSVSRPMIIPKKYQGMYKKPITPGKRLNRDVQMDYDFEAENRDEISVRRGEILRGLRFADQDTAQWLIVENNQGRRGVVPVSLVSVFSSSDEEEEGEERRAPPRRARRISTQSTGTDVSSASTDQSEWQRAQQQQEEKWRRENEDLRNQLQEMRVEMQSIKSTTTTSPAEPEQQQQQQPTTSNAKAIMSQPPTKSDRGAYATPNAAAMNEAFQKGSTGAAPQLQQQPASGMQQRPQHRQQQPPSSLSGTRQTGPVIMTLNAPPPPQQREEQEPPPPPPTIQRERAQGKAEDEDNWVEPQQQQESATTAGEQEGEHGEQQQAPQKDKKRSGVLRWILGSGDKDKKQQQQQQQQQPITSEEHEEEEGKREDSTSGGEGRAVFLNKPPAESGTKAEYTTPSSAIELGPEQSQQQSESSGDADDPANWVQGFDPKYQRNFYFNTRTKESTWTKPSSWRSGGKTISSETTQQQQQQQEQPMTAA